MFFGQHEQHGEMGPKRRTQRPPNGRPTVRSGGPRSPCCDVSGQKTLNSKDRESAEEQMPGPRARAGDENPSRIQCIWVQNQPFWTQNTVYFGPKSAILDQNTRKAQCILVQNDHFWTKIHVKYSVFWSKYPFLDQNTRKIQCIWLARLASRPG